MTNSFPRFSWLPLGIACLLCLNTPPLARGQGGAGLFSTGFEPAEGYDITKNLAGQNGWLEVGSGGNGIVTNFFTDGGQQAFIGFAPLADTNDTLTLWHPINYAPDSQHPAQVQFSVRMDIVASTNQYQDNFRWSALNTFGSRLFTVDFNTRNYLISYALDNRAGYIPTIWYFTNSTVYTLAMNIDFATNRWSATLGSTIIVTNQPITTTGLALNLGDIDVVWTVCTIGNSGNNYMLFDDWKVTVATNAAPGPMIQRPLRQANGEFGFHVSGQPNRSYAVEATTNLVNWSVVTTNNAADSGGFDFSDPVTSLFKSRYYRTRQLGP